METDRYLPSLTVAVVVGLVTMIVANQLGHGGDLLAATEYLASKGLLVGSLAGFFAFGITKVLLASQRVRIWALLSAGIVSGLFGLLVTNWNLLWGFSLFSLEGAWSWPLAIVPFVLSFLSFKRWRRARRT